MDISNKITYYMKIMSAYIVNKNSADDPSGEELKRAQIFIPTIQPEMEIHYNEYLKSSGKTSSEYFRDYPWAFNTVENLNDGDLVYVASLNNLNGDYLIIGRDATCFPTGGVGGSGELNAASLAELIIPFIIHHECGIHANLPSDHTKNKYNPTTKSHGNLYECVGWDSEVPDTAYACYVTSTSSSASVGLFNWDASRGYDILIQVAQKDSSWSSYWNTSYDLYREIKGNAEGTSSSKSKGIQLFRTSQEDVIYSIQKMLASSVGKEVQKNQARLDATGYIQWMMDKGATNVALLLFVADTINQYGKSLTKLYDAAVNPSSINVDTNKLNATMSTYENKSTMMEDFERVAQWFLDEYEPGFKSRYTDRRKDCIAYIRELYKQGKLSQFEAGLTMVGDLPAYTHRGITIVSPFKDEIVAAYQSDYYGGKMTHSFKNHKINTYFGSYKSFNNGGGHPGVDFNIKRGDIYYASHDGKLVIADTGGDGRGYGYGYHAKLTFTDGGHNWTIIYGHMDRKLSPQYFNKGTYDVKAGQAIGAGDSSGNSTGDHLHYEIRMDNSPINPLLFLGMGDAHTTLQSGYIND